MRQNPFANPLPPKPLAVPATIPVQTLVPPAALPDPTDNPVVLKPTDLAGLEGWLEIHPDGSIVNRLEHITGRKQTAVASIDPNDYTKITLLLYNRVLSDSELQMLSAH